MQEVADNIRQLVITGTILSTGIWEFGTLSCFYTGDIIEEVIEVHEKEEGKRHITNILVSRGRLAQSGQKYKGVTISLHQITSQFTSCPEVREAWVAFDEILYVLLLMEHPVHNEEETLKEVQKFMRKNYCEFGIPWEARILREELRITKITPDYIIDLVKKGKENKQSQCSQQEQQQQQQQQLYSQSCTAAITEDEITPQQIAQIMTDILNNGKTVGVDDDFFSCGGDSHQAYLVNDALHDLLSLHTITIDDIYHHSTPSSLHAYLVKRKQGMTPNRTPSVQPQQTTSPMKVPSPALTSVVSTSSLPTIHPSSDYHYEFYRAFDFKKCVDCDPIPISNGFCCCCHGGLLKWFSVRDNQVVELSKMVIGVDTHTIITDTQISVANNSDVLGEEVEYSVTFYKSKNQSTLLVGTRKRHFHYINLGKNAVMKSIEVGGACRFPPGMDQEICAFCDDDRHLYVLNVEKQELCACIEMHHTCRATPLILRDTNVTLLSPTKSDVTPLSSKKEEKEGIYWIVCVTRVSEVMIYKYENYELVLHQEINLDGCVLADPLFLDNSLYILLTEGKLIQLSLTGEILSTIHLEEYVNPSFPFVWKPVVMHDDRLLVSCTSGEVVVVDRKEKRVDGVIMVDMHQSTWNAVEKRKLMCRFNACTCDQSEHICRCITEWKGFHCQHYYDGIDTDL